MYPNIYEVFDLYLQCISFYKLTSELNRASIKEGFVGSSLVAQWVKDPALSLLWLRELRWLGFNPLAWELLLAVGTAKKNYGHQSQSHDSAFVNE